jgi:hypothetical protein
MQQNDMAEWAKNMKYPSGAGGMFFCRIRLSIQAQPLADNKMYGANGLDCFGMGQAWQCIYKRKKAANGGGE